MSGIKSTTSPMKSPLTNPIMGSPLLMSTGHNSQLGSPPGSPCSWPWLLSSGPVTSGARDNLVNVMRSSSDPSFLAQAEPSAPLIAPSPGHTPAPQAHLQQPLTPTLTQSLPTRPPLLPLPVDFRGAPPHIPPGRPCLPLLLPVAPFSSPMTPLKPSPSLTRDRPLPPPSSSCSRTSPLAVRPASSVSPVDTSTDSPPLQLPRAAHPLRLAPSARGSSQRSSSRQLPGSIHNMVPHFLFASLFYLPVLIYFCYVLFFIFPRTSGTWGRCCDSSLGLTPS